ncbi:condensation domain-containing protein [Streptomyces sp. INA 01156]
MHDRGPGRPHVLHLAVHHLVVDGVSWRLLLEDLDGAYRARRAGRDGAAALPRSRLRCGTGPSASPRTPPPAASTTRRPTGRGRPKAPGPPCRRTGRAPTPTPHSAR